MEANEWEPGDPKVRTTTRTDATVRIPISKIDRVLRFVREREDELPLYGHSVPAGFPSPADDYAEVLG